MTLEDLIADLTAFRAEVDEVTIPVDLKEAIEEWMSSERLKKHAANPVAADEPI